MIISSGSSCPAIRGGEVLLGCVALPRVALIGQLWAIIRNAVGVGRGGCLPICGFSTTKRQRLVEGIQKAGSLFAETAAQRGRQAGRAVLLL